MSLRFVPPRRRRTPEWLALGVPLAGLCALAALLVALSHH